MTRHIELVVAIAERLALEQSKNPELQELSMDAQPEKVLDRMDQMEGGTVQDVKL